MGPHRLITAVALSSVFAGACRDRGVQALHERRYFAGDVSVEVREGAVPAASWDGEVTFDRDADNYQLTLRREDGTVALSRGPGGAVVGFRDGVPGAVTETDAARFEQLMLLIEGLPAGSEVVRRGAGYEVRAGARTTIVRLSERPYAHGK